MFTYMQNTWRTIEDDLLPDAPRASRSGAELAQQALVQPLAVHARRAPWRLIENGH